MNRKSEMVAFGRLLDIMDELREKCPWDREQTLESLRPLTIEETFELSEAIMQKDNANISKELGDILLHIVFYSKIGSETGEFNMIDVINQLCDKLIYRHPHIFAKLEVDNVDDVLRNWEQLKRTEKGGNKTVLSGVPASLPSLVKAYRMQDKARAVGFDWDEKDQVWDKVAEEYQEFKEELSSLNDILERGDDNSKQLEDAKFKAESELGDFIFSIVNAARLYDLNPDTALELTNMKFRNRFNHIELRSKELEVDLKDMTLEEMEELWAEAKVLEKNKI